MRRTELHEERDSHRDTRNSTRISIFLEAKANTTLLKKSHRMCKKLFQELPVGLKP